MMRKRVGTRMTFREGRAQVDVVNGKRSPSVGRYKGGCTYGEGALRYIALPGVAWRFNDDIP